MKIVQIEKALFTFDSKFPFENAEAFQWDIVAIATLYPATDWMQYGCLQEANLIQNGNSRSREFPNNWTRSISIKTLKICLFKMVRKINKAMEIDAFMKYI